MSVLILYVCCVCSTNVGVMDIFIIVNLSCCTFFSFGYLYPWQSLYRISSLLFCLSFLVIPIYCINVFHGLSLWVFFHVHILSFVCCDFLLHALEMLSNLKNVHLFIVQYEQCRINLNTCTVCIELPALSHHVLEEPVLMFPNIREVLFRSW